MKTEIVYTNGPDDMFDEIDRCVVDGDDVLIVHPTGRERRIPLRLIRAYDRVEAGEYVRTVNNLTTKSQ